MCALQKFWQERRSGNGVMRDGDYRSPYMRDECRVVHSFGFRRLRGKTQLLGPDQSDYNRNRMTHSIEVASIARSIAAYLRNKYKGNKKYLKLLGNDAYDYDYLITAISLLHDIGHPPFGHAGETALNYKMHNHGGFEGNAQTIRLVAKLEKFTQEFGLDLTRRTILGLLKYPVSYERLCCGYSDCPMRNRDIIVDNWKPPKCYYDEDQDVIDWLFEPLKKSDKNMLLGKDAININDEGQKESRFKSFDCSIMDIADDIAYSIHDLEDAIYLRQISESEFNEIKNKLIIFDGGTKYIKKLFDKDRSKNKEAIGYMINLLIQNLEIIETYELHGLDKPSDFHDPVLSYNVKLNKDAKGTVEGLKTLIKNKVIESQQVQSIIFGGMLSIMQLFDALIANPKVLLDESDREKIDQQENLHRIVGDYIAGMTDEYAYRLHERIFGDNPRSVFEKL